MTITIRPWFEKEDGPATLARIVAGAGFGPSRGTSDFWDRAPAFVIFLALLDDRPVGWLEGRIGTSWEQFEQLHHVATIENIGVVADSQRLGIGTALVEHFLHRAAAAGCTEARLAIAETTAEETAKRAAFWRRCGFESVPDLGPTTWIRDVSDGLVPPPDDDRFVG